MRLRHFSFLLLLLTQFASGQVFQNHSLEIWNDSICEKNIPPAGWVNFTSVGLGPDEGNYHICASTIPARASDGHVYARMMAGTHAGEGMKQDLLGFVVGGFYTMAFDYAGSNLWGGTDDVRWHLFIDSVEVDSTPVFNSLDTTWRVFSHTFVPTRMLHNIGVRLYVAGQPHGGGSGGIDNFRFTRIATNIEETELVADISPVPAENYLHVQALPGIEYTFYIYDLRGILLKEERFSGSDDLDVSSFPTGLYFYRMNDSRGRSRSGKLLKD